MKSLIAKLLRESLLGEARITLNDMDRFVLIYLSEDNIFLIIDKENKEPMGYISFGLTDGNVYGIYGAYAKRGFGPLLYEIVMTYVFPNGITMSDDSTTSGDALNVWNKFYERGDVDKEPIIRKNKTEKEKLLDIDGQDNYSPEELNNLLKLHHTQFIFSFGKSKLNKLINLGHKFRTDNPGLDYMSMVYSLE